MGHSAVDCDKCKAYCGAITDWKWVTSEEHEALLREEFNKPIISY